MFLFSLGVTVVLYAVPAMLLSAELPSWQAHFGWAIGWAIFVIALFFVGMLRAPDKDGHGHTPMALLLGMILGMAINISILQSLGESIF